MIPFYSIIIQHPGQQQQQKCKQYPVRDNHVQFHIIVRVIWCCPDDQYVEPGNQLPVV